MPMIKKSFNKTGLWLSSELNRRGIQMKDFAYAVGTTPQQLSFVLRENNLAAETMARWNEKFNAALEALK